MSQDTIEAEANLREMERWRDAQRPGSKERKLYEVLVLYARRAYERVGFRESARFSTVMF